MMIYCTILGEINDKLCIEAHRAICTAEANKQPLTLYIDSLGGEVDAGTSLAIRIKNAKIKVTTHALQNVASIALLVFAAGHRRVCSKYTAFLFHSISQDMGLEKIKAIESNLLEMKRENQKMIRMLCEYSGFSESFLTKKSNEKEDYTFKADEAVKLKLVHQIYDKDKK